MARLNQKDSEILQTGKNIDFLSPEYAYFNGEFGNDPNDFVEALVHDEQENFLESSVVDKDEFTLNDDGTIVGQNGENLFVKENKYVIQEISPSRKEIRLIVQNISDRQYLSDFFNLQRDKKLISSERLGLGPVEFHINEGLLPEKKQYSHIIQLPINATSNMIGGYIYLNDSYLAKLSQFEVLSEQEELDMLYQEQTDYDYGGS
jgi:hypothetical protein